MKFYLLFYQLTGYMEQLDGGMKYLSANALRTSPKEGRANRALLDQCVDLLRTMRGLLDSKAHISKVQLRRTALLFQALEIAHRRVLCLAGAEVPGDEDSLEAHWWLLSRAERDYQDLRVALRERTDAPIHLALPEEDRYPSYAEVLRKESLFQEEILKLIEKCIEVFDEEMGLRDQLALVRKALLESRKNAKRLLAGQPLEGTSAVPSRQDMAVTQK